MMPFAMERLWTLQPLIVLSCCLMYVDIVSGDSQKRIEASAPVNPVEKGGILALHCQVWSLDTNLGEEVTILKNGVHRLTIDETLTKKADDRMYLAVRQLLDGSTVYFLTIMDAQKEDEGDYICKITYPDNSKDDIEASVTLRTKYFPSDSNPQCESTDLSSVRIGQTITLSCSSEEGYPRVSLEWSQTKSKLSSIGKTTTEIRNGRLYSDVTFQVIPEDVGSIFMCTVESDVFPDEKRSCHVGPLVLDKNNPGYIVPDSKRTSLMPSNKPLATMRPVDGINKVSFVPQECRTLCLSHTSSLTYWTIGTVVAGIVAIILCIWVVILFVKFRNLPRTCKPRGYIAGRQLPEGIYSEVESNRCPNSMYITLEKKKKRVEPGLPIRDTATHLLQKSEPC